MKNPWSPGAQPFMPDRTQIFALAAQPGLRFPFTSADELHPDAKKPDKKDDKKDDKTKPKLEIALDGIERALFQVPVAPGNYGALSVTDGVLFFLNAKDAAIG